MSLTIYGMDYNQQLALLNWCKKYDLDIGDPMQDMREGHWHYLARAKYHFEKACGNIDRIEADVLFIKPYGVPYDTTIN